MFGLGWAGNLGKLVIWLDWARLDFWLGLEFWLGFENWLGGTRHEISLVSDWLGLAGLGWRFVWVGLDWVHVLFWLEIWFIGDVAGLDIWLG